MLKNNPNIIPKVTDKFYTCPQCNRPYETTHRDGLLFGRCPVIINCKHTICEFCVRSSINKKQVTCPICSTATEFNVKCDNKFKRVFPINLYILGHLIKSNPSGFADKSPNLNLKPAGSSVGPHARNPPRALSVTSPNRSESDCTSLQYNSTEYAVNACSQKRCNSVAKLHCNECAENYCSKCSETLHGSARGLQAHCVVAIDTSIDSTVQEKCTLHPDSFLEYRCDDCNETMCSHCAISDHRNHVIHNVTTLDSKLMPELKTLAQDADQMLSRLLLTLKETSETLQEQETTSADDSKQKICKFFANLHGHLQTIENNLLAECQNVPSQQIKSLNDVSKQLNSNIRSIKRLKKSVDEVLNPACSVKLNVRQIIDSLKTALEYPCFLSTKLKTCNESNIEIRLASENDNFNESLTYSKYNCKSYTLLPLSDMPIGTKLITPADHNDEVSSTEDSITDESILKSHELSPLQNLNLDAASSSSAKTMSFARLNLETGPKMRPINWKIGNQQQVKVTHINDPESFYVQLRDRKNSFRKMKEQIAKSVKRPSTMHDPKINSIYAVCFNNNNSREWCRARITNIHNNNKKSCTMYQVFFIDYGNTSSVDRNSVIKLPDALLTEEPFAYHCKIYDIYPVGQTWSSEALLVMAQILTGDFLLSYDNWKNVRHLLEGNNAVIHIKNNDNPTLLEVELVAVSNKEEGISVRNTLLFLGNASCLLNPDLVLHNLNSIDVQHSAMKIFKVKLVRGENQISKVTIKHIINPHDMYINLCENETYLEKMQEDLSTYYTHTAKHYKMYNPKIEMLVAVQHPKTREWFRGVIKSLLTNGNIKVNLIDYGEDIIVYYTALRKLNEKFARLDMQAVHVKLADIAPAKSASDVAEWNNDVKDFMYAHYNGKSLSMIIKSVIDSPFNVILLDNNNSICVNALLVNKGFAVSIGPSSADLHYNEEEKQMPCNADLSKLDEINANNLLQDIRSEMSESSNSSSATLMKTIISRVDQEVDGDSVKRIKISIHKVQTPNVFYVNLLSTKDKYQKMFQNILSHYSSRKASLKVNYGISDYCVVYSAKNMHYCRAQIQEVLEDGQLKMYLLDKGEEEIVGTECVYEIERPFSIEIMPAAAIKCTLSGIKPAGGTPKWSLMACDKFEDILTDFTDFSMSKRGSVSENKSVPIKLWCSKTTFGSALEPGMLVECLINKELIDRGLALPVCEEIKISITGDDVVQSQIASVSRQKTDEEKTIPSSPTIKHITDWLPPILMKEQTFNAIPTYIDDYGVIYFHPVDIEDIFQNLERFIEDHCRNTISNQYQKWSAGDLCIVKYHANGKWYRGKVQETITDEEQLKVIVSMIDYGNVEEVSLDELRREIIHPDVPILASQCILQNVYPSIGKRWVTSDVDLLHRTIVGKKCIINVTDKQTPDRPYPAIITINNDVLNNFIVTCGTHLSSNPSEATTASLYYTEDVVIESLSANVNTSSRSSNYEDAVFNSEDDDYGGTINIVEQPKSANKKYTPSKINFNQTVGTIISVLDYDEMIIELSSEKSVNDLFLKMSVEMQSVCADLTCIDNFIVGMPCVALYDDDKQWYRAQVFKIDSISEDKVNIWFVDYGNFEDILLKNIRVIPDAWLQLTVHQYLCKVKDIELVNELYRPHVLNGLEDILPRCITMNVTEQKDNKLFVTELFPTNSATNFYQSFIDQNMIKLTT